MGALQSERPPENANLMFKLNKPQALAPEIIDYKVILEFIHQVILLVGLNKTIMKTEIKY